MKLILGSKSPRRAQILEHFQIPFTLRQSQVDESQITNSIPYERAQMLSELKSQAITIEEDEILLTSDTIVTMSGSILEKPTTKDEARYMLQRLSGETHTVITAYTLRTVDKWETELVKTNVAFYKLTDEEIEAYIETDEPYDKAGGYGIQEKGALFVKHIKGDYLNVVGLPISKLVRSLKDFGMHIV